MSLKNLSAFKAFLSGQSFCVCVFAVECKVFAGRMERSIGKKNKSQQKLKSYRLVSELSMQCKMLVKNSKIPKNCRLFLTLCAFNLPLKNHLKVILQIT